MPVQGPYARQSEPEYVSEAPIDMTTAQPMSSNHICGHTHMLHHHECLPPQMMSPHTHAGIAMHPNGRSDRQLGGLEVLPPAHMVGSQSPTLAAMQSPSTHTQFYQMFSPMCLQMLHQQQYGSSVPAMSGYERIPAVLDAVDESGRSTAEAEEEPIYVNPKQYKRILRRREQRAKSEKQTLANRAKKTYMHESRHQHAMRRPRGPGGRFLPAHEVSCEATKPEKNGVETSV